MHLFPGPRSEHGIRPDPTSPWRERESRTVRPEALAARPEIGGDLRDQSTDFPLGRPYDSMNALAFSHAVREVGSEEARRLFETAPGPTSQTVLVRFKPEVGQDGSVLEYLDHLGLTAG